MEALIALLKAKGLTIGSCESLTAGLFASEMAAVPGASAVLRGGIITYQTAVKSSLVQVEESCMKRYGVISEATALQMAIHARELLGADICVSFSGNAGPDVMEGKPVGMVCCAIASSNKQYRFTLQLSGGRNEIRKLCVKHMVQTVIEFIEDELG